MIEYVLERAALTAEQTQCAHAHGASAIHSGDDIAAVAGGGNADQHITGAGERFDLAGEHGIKAKIIADGGQG